VSASELCVCFYCLCESLSVFVSLSVCESLSLYICVFLIVIVQPDSKIKLDDKIIGYQLKIEKKKIYVSVGHKISLKTAIKIVKELILDKNWYPEPLLLADLNSKLVK